ncbi:MAG: BT4734/BF3469 family protein [Prevotellaceae bacterium]|nr:BT4734/BF3469 family protein [Prevotellaceae bacterium]
MFGYIKNINGGNVRNCTPEIFYSAIDDPYVARVCAELEDALEKRRRGEMSREDYDTLKNSKKRRLPAFTPHAMFKNGRRCNGNAVPSGLSMYDVDHISDPRGYYDEKVKGKEKRLGVVLAHVTPSTEGLRLFFIIPQGMDIVNAQKWMSEQLGDDQYDQCVKDLARSSFAVPRSYIIYIDEENLFKTHETIIATATAETLTQNPDNAKESATDNGKAETSATETSEEAAKQEATKTGYDSERTFKGVRYADIIRAYFKTNGGEPVEGERHSKLLKLAAHLRAITDNSEALLMEIMPRYGLPEEELQKIVKDSCGSKLYGISKVMKKTLEKVGIIDEEADDDDDECDEEEASTSPPEMPKELPPLIKLLVSKTPAIYKPAVAHAVFPPLAVHLYKTRFRYIDNVEHEATLMNVLMAGTGAGKNCISKPIKHILADIKKRDAENLRREREWKNEVNSKGSNKDKRQRPDGLIIQCIDADMTNPAFVMRTAEADGHFLYTKMNEIEQFDSLKGNGKSNHQFQIMCLAFDPENEYGQTRVGTQSITEKVQVRFNWNASTTITKGKDYFKKVLTNGPISRLNFCTIPEQEIGADMPVYLEYDKKFDEQLKPYIDNLNKTTGRIICNEASQLARKLKEECADYARQSMNRVYENLSYRALVIAWLKACVLYVANGQKWDPTFDEFIRWSLHYDLWCKMEFFGDAIMKAEQETTSSTHRGRRNLLEVLPDVFTKDDAAKARQQNGMKASGTRHMLSIWKSRGYIMVIEKDRYKKTVYNS